MLDCNSRAWSNLKQVSPSAVGHRSTCFTLPCKIGFYRQMACQKPDIKSNLLEPNSQIVSALVFLSILSELGSLETESKKNERPLQRTACCQLAETRTTAWAQQWLPTDMCGTEVLRANGIWWTSLQNHGWFLVSKLRKAWFVESLKPNTI